MRRSTTILLIVALVYMLSACASIDTKVYGGDNIQTVNAWTIDFAYETGATEQLQKSTGDSEVKVVRTGQLPSDLQLRDDLYFSLKDEYGISVTKKFSETTGRIQIHPIHFQAGGFKLLTVTLVDQKGETIARLKIKNGDRNATFKNDEDFTKYAAEAIAQAVKPK